MIRISEIRHKHGMTQSEFGDLFQVSQNTVSQWERGTRGIDSEMILRIADWFEITTDYLLGRDMKHPEGLVYADGNTGFLYLDVHDLSPESRKELLDFVDFLKSRR